MESEIARPTTASNTLLGDSSSELMGVYKPRTQETKLTYEAILAYIQDALGDQVKQKSIFKFFVIK